ncbi:hypothetical protein RUM43_012788 [Polyplax serrata]|uniref:UDENN domain-containing protein n=1 Tax=Polyplax serrata TaxID=468196 RepID=A0AAN8RZC8_POLSC
MPLHELPHKCKNESNKALEIITFSWGSGELSEEKDVNNETLLVWAYPSVTTEKRQYLLRKYHGINSQTNFFVFVRYNNEWCYFNVTQVFVTDNLPQVKQFALVIWASDYNPEKYDNLCRILSKRYCKTGDPTVVLQLYLSVMTGGVCTTEENGMFSLTDFQSRRKPENSDIKDLIKLFGLEIILIYTTLLLNKRLIIYHHSLDSLLKWVQIIPYLMVHRNFDGITFPWVHLESDELLNLKCCDGFIAGSTDKGIESLNDMFDVFVNVPAREVTISPYSRDYFAMTKTHKDIALFIVQLSENPNLEEYQIITEIAKKTQELLSQLRLLASVVTPDGRKVVSIETLKEKNLAPALESFLFNLSVAEKMIML